MMFKKSILILVIALFIVPTSSCTKNKNWAVKIDDEVISIDEYNRFYYTQNKILLNKKKEEIDEISKDPSSKDHPTLDKYKFLDFLVSRKLLCKKAFDDESLDSENLDVVTDLFKLQGLATYYLSKKLMDQILVSDDEIGAFYQKNRNLFKGVPLNDEVLLKIKQQISYQKFEQKSSEFVMNLIAESKVNKDGFKKYLSKASEKSSDDKDKKAKLYKPGDIAVRIDDEKISFKEFFNYYYAQNQILLNTSKEEIDKLSNDPSMAEHPTVNKSKFMDFIISRKLLYKKIMNDDSLDQEELETVIELFKLQGVSTYYLSIKLKDDINVADEEIDNFYKTNKKLFKGVPINDQVIEKIKQQIFMQKFEQKSSEFVLNLIAESKVNREGLKNYLTKKPEQDDDKSDKKETKETTK